MQLSGSRGQQQRDVPYDASGTIAAGTVSQLVLPERKSTSFLFVQNLSNDLMYLEIGGARGTATIVSGAVASVAAANGGFGYVRVPKVELFGGGSGGNSAFNGVGLPGWPAPGDAGFTQPRGGSVTARPAKVRAVLTAGIVTSFVVDDGGSGYVAAPYVDIQNDLLDPFGVADPNFGGNKSGILLGAGGGSFTWNGTHCPTAALSLYAATTSDAYTIKWAP